MKNGDNERATDFCSAAVRCRTCDCSDARPERQCGSRKAAAQSNAQQTTNANQGAAHDNRPPCFGDAVRPRRLRRPGRDAASARPRHRASGPMGALLASARPTRTTADESLQLAERSFARDGDTPGTRDLAYVADRRAQIAEVRGDAMQAGRQQQLTSRSDARRRNSSAGDHLGQAGAGQHATRESGSGACRRTTATCGGRGPRREGRR